MRLLLPFYVSLFTLSVVASPVTNDLENPFTEIHQRDLPQTDLHPDNFTNIQGAHAIHDLIKDLSPLVENVASLANMKMEKLLDGTPFDFDPQFAEANGATHKRSFSDIMAVMAEVSRVMLNFIARAAEYAKQPLIRNIAETLHDAMG